MSDSPAFEAEPILLLITEEIALAQGYPISAVGTNVIVGWTQPPEPTQITLDLPNG